jgi:ubiquinone/menaquinone biosynthesis C-methylase UbiE
MKEDFYQKVESYYDGDAADFDKRYWSNPELQRIRQDFREQVKRFHFEHMLEIGCGTGLDLVHFATTFPEVRVTGIDISGEMHRVANDRILNSGLNNVTAHKGNIEDFESLFPDQKFDMIIVFFGALNTVSDLEKTAVRLNNVTAPGGVLVLSFVNKYYLGGMLIELFKLRLRSAFSRLKPVWGGYSPMKFLPSHCYSPAEIMKAFSSFKLLSRKGYSIVHPAWYYHRINRFLGRLRYFLWTVDVLLNRTPLWKYGEYTLFVFQKTHNSN